LVTTPVILSCLFVPGLKSRRQLARWGAATVFKLIGSPVTVDGQIGERSPLPLVVANHSSYLDGMILTAVLPPQYTFLIKREMNSVPIAGFILRRLGSEFVDRASAAQRHRSARRLLEHATHGHAIAVFPEGTFDEQPGLKAFHLGAFRAAHRAGLDVVPVTIRGARQKLPSGALLPAPGPLSVTIGELVSADDANNEHRLMRAAREQILEHLREPDLAPHTMLEPV